MEGLLLQLAVAGVAAIITEMPGLGWVRSTLAETVVRYATACITVVSPPPPLLSRPQYGGKRTGCGPARR